MPTVVELIGSPVEGPGEPVPPAAAITLLAALGLLSGLHGGECDL